MGRVRQAPRLPIRYMGTKRQLAPLVRRIIGDLRPGSRIADLFGGMGSVSRAMAPHYSVLLNDQLSFAVAVAKAQLTDARAWDSPTAIRAMAPFYESRVSALAEAHADRVEAENRAAAAGPRALAEFVGSAPHVGNSSEYAVRSAAAATRSGPERYELVTLYFGSSYFSTRQAIELDSIRYAIDQLPGDTLQLQAAWLSVASAVMNAPGHTAQYLRPHSAASAERVLRQWVRSPFRELPGRIRGVRPISSRRWRQGNRVSNADALEVLATNLMDDVRLVYADPPYTKDHYSRYYHVLETLYKYDFPSSTGLGRYRHGRFRTPFSVATLVESAFRELAKQVRAREVPLVLSYPANGLLEQVGVSVSSVLSDYFKLRGVHSVDYRHSTLGGSSGLPTKQAMERIYVCVP
jgi:adenine-specific DNA-methyltransferase